MTNSELNGISHDSLGRSYEAGPNVLRTRWHDFGNVKVTSSPPQCARPINQASSPQSLAVLQKRLQLLFDLNSRTVSDPEVSEWLHELAVCIRRAIQCDAASIALLDPEDSYACRECALEYPGNSGRVHSGHLAEERAVWLSKLIDTGAPVSFTATELEAHAVAYAEGFRSLCHIPLISRARVCGVLTVASSKENNFADDEMVFLRQVASSIAIVVGSALARHPIATLKEQLASERIYLEEDILSGGMFEEMVGSSKTLLRTLEHVARVAPTDSTVLITGESGTGKELVARAIHKRSHRAKRPFIRVHCAAIPASLIASELFGHEKGAFTGATERRLGRFELANGGTIFLDEIGDIPADTQIALLRVLQEREFERVGGSHPVSVNVRVVAATNRNLRAAVEAGTFRLDLFYRLNVFPVRVPSLRERKDDIPLLTKYYIERHATMAGKRIRNIDKKTLELFQEYHWPGNIRELQNVIERAVILCDGETFSVDESWVRREAPRVPETPIALTGALVSREKEMIEAALEESRGRVCGPSGAAVKLGIPRSTLESKIRSLRINKFRFRAEEPAMSTARINPLVPLRYE
jgi:formate hydrogenlyase transcriptional activator